MKKLLLLVLFLPYTALLAQFEDYFVRPSYYFTYGDYSNGDISRSHAAYTTFQYTRKYYFTAVYERLTITSRDWDYGQQMLLGGMLFSSYPYYIKGYAGTIRGDFRLNRNELFDASVYDYSDNTHIFSLDASGYIWPYLLGASVTYMNADGVLNADSLKRQSSVQTVLRFENTVLPSLFISVRPAFTYLKDGRKLFSVAAKVNYQLFEDIVIKAGGFIGKRAYYFDADLLTIYNQDATQKWNASAQIDYSLTDELTFSVSAITSKFDIYKINYFVAGVKGVIPLW